MNLEQLVGNSAVDDFESLVLQRDADLEKVNLAIQVLSRKWTAGVCRRKMLLPDQVAILAETAEHFFRLGAIASEQLRGDQLRQCHFADEVADDTTPTTHQH